jgi:hypothetical protein
VVQQLVSIAPQIGNDADKVVIQQALRRLLNHHRPAQTIVIGQKADMSRTPRDVR